MMNRAEQNWPEGEAIETCPMIDAHVHPDTILYGNVQGRTVFYLEHHPSLIRFEAERIKHQWEAAPTMLEALEQAKAVIEAVHQAHAEELWLGSEYKAVCDAINKAVRQ